MSFALLSVDGICPRCGHCGICWGACANCERLGREAPQMRVRTAKDAYVGIPEPLFFIDLEGNIAV